jgi:hypothetical protein
MSLRHFWVWIGRVLTVVFRGDFWLDRRLMDQGSEFPGKIFWGIELGLIQRALKSLT